MVEKSHTAGLWPSLYEPFKAVGSRMADWLAPASDASVGDDAYTITMELPGVEEGDIDVSVSDGVITVKGEKSATREDKGDTWYFSERQYGAFSRAFRLPQDANGDKVAANLKDGILTLSVPKRGPDEAPSSKVKITKG
ncbi:MAG: Hsp20/alpha crystallin family protein [Sediminimonas qiaohouensis]|uniref:Hsp20/alpha crystallin family protein n=1 Tax=Sediminimonas qiaohouensis TaxID=552061 RepID=A0A7C9H9Q6_9RHOB|nr:Hsp20/alpha crystallin family protein [Sediminimonas qiaohouensis]MTJ03649.1 Hsp20/alpha crystallin family protein [Sediminimonas qiaohouensis]